MWVMRHVLNEKKSSSCSSEQETLSWGEHSFSERSSPMSSQAQASSQFLSPTSALADGPFATGRRLNKNTQAELAEISVHQSHLAKTCPE